MEEVIGVMGKWRQKGENRRAN